MTSARTRNFSVLAVLAAVVLATSTVHATWYKPTTWFKKKVKRPELMVVTGNYVKSRILAELIQTRKKYPVLLLPTGSEKNMFALGPKKEAMEISADDFNGFVDHHRPRQILFLGDENYTPKKWIEAVKNDHACWVADSADWEQVAISAERMLRIKNLAIDYLFLIHQLDEKGRPIQPTVVPSKREYEKFMNPEPAAAKAKK